MTVPRIRKPYFYMLLGTVAGAALIISVNRVEAFRLRIVEIDGKLSTREESRQLGLDPGAPVFSQNLASAANMMSNRVGIGAVRISYAGIDKIKIETNRFRPVLSAHDNATGRILNIDALGRVTPFDSAASPSGPFLVGLGHLALFERVSDLRVVVVVEELARLRESNVQLYGQVSEIDMRDASFVGITFSTRDFVLLSRPEGMAERIVEMDRIANGAAGTLQGADTVDARYQDIVVVSQVNQSGIHIEPLLQPRSAL